MKNMIVIQEEQASTVLTIKEAIDVVRATFLACNRGEIYPGGRVVMPVAGEENSGQWLTAVHRPADLFGSKFSAVFPNNPKLGLPSVLSEISLYSGTTGEQVALISANQLTAVKTGAGAGVATDLLARADACRLGIIGTGVQAFTQVTAIQEVRELKELRIFDQSEARMDAFAEKIAAVQNRPYAIIKCTSGDQCAAGSDIISTCTASTTPVFHGNVLQPGTHINAIGSFTPQMQEIDAETVRRSCCIVSEHVEGLWAAAGDILIPLEKGEISRDVVSGCVGDLLDQKIPGRQAENDITLYEAVGSCALDIAIAAAVYQKARG